MTRSLRLLLPAVVLATTSGCILEWVEWVQSLDNLATSGDEHRVQDLRVLAIEAEPPELRYRPALFEADHDELPTLRLQVEAFAYDPRGGEIQTTVQLCPTGSRGRASFGPRTDLAGCAGAAELSGLTPAELAALAPVDRVLAADPDDPAGRVQGLTWEYVLTPAAQRALLALAEQTAPSADGITLQVVVRVSRTFAGQRETEWAVLPLVMRADLFSGVDEAIVQRVLDEERRELCAPDDPPRDCIDPAFVPQPYDAPSTCGDEIVEGPEQCDPPDGLVCDDACQLLNVCETSCLWAVEPNLRPVVFGFDRDVSVSPEIPTARLAQENDAELAPGAEIPLRPGEAVSLGVVLDAASMQRYAFETDGRPPIPREPGGDGPREAPPDGDDEPPPAVSFIESEIATTSWYITGNDGAIEAPVTFDGLFLDQGFTGAIRYRSAVERRPGERKPIFVIVNDARGGMAVARVDLVFE